MENVSAFEIYLLGAVEGFLVGAPDFCLLGKI